MSDEPLYSTGEGDAVKQRIAERRDESLRLANKIRTENAALKNALRSKDVDAINLLEGGDPEWEEVLMRLRVADVLMAIPNFGRVITEEVMEEMRMGANVRFRDLTPNRREGLTDIIRTLKWRPR